MSMLLLTLAAATPIVAPKHCNGPTTEKVATRGPVRPTRLGEMPPARQVLAVYRSVDGCPVPVVIRQEVGTNRRR